MERPEKTTHRVRGTTTAVSASARVLRRTETPAAQMLWQALRGRRLDGLKFRRQHAVGRLVLDSYCPDRKLVVELAGTAHVGYEEQHAYRTHFLASYGYRVLRFGNEEVMTNLPNVLHRIVHAAFLGSTAGPSSEDVSSESAPPLPELGEGVGG